MAGQFPFSNASGDVILKGILEKLQITISQLEKETGLSYSSLQRIYNGETKKITLPVYTALKEWNPSLRDEYLRDAQLPIFDYEAPDAPLSDDVDIISILNNARKILQLAEQKEMYLKEWESRLIERSKILDQRAKDMDSTMSMLLLQKNAQKDEELAKKLSDNKNESV